MKILVGIPCLYGAEHTKKAIDSVINEADVLVIDNGAEKEVNDLISAYGSRVFCIKNPVNVYVNPAWNQIMEFFLAGKWDRLVIMNSDLIMQYGWSKRLRDGIIPIISDDNCKTEIVCTEGTPGVFICLDRKMTEIVYPIPPDIKVWFGDNWIFETLRSVGYQTIMIPGLKAHHWHNGSQTVQRVPGISEIIEDDKIAWEQIVEPAMRKNILKM